MNILDTAEIILYYHLDSTHYTRENHNMMDEWRDRVETYLYTTGEEETVAEYSLRDSKRL